MVDLPDSFKEIEMIILDMDGVVTSEESYWDTAGLTIQDLLESPAFLGLNPPAYSPVLDVFYKRLIRGDRTEWRKYLPPELILHIKTKGINSNWDLTYIVLGLYLALLFRTPVNALYYYVFHPHEELPSGPKDIPVDIPAEIHLMQDSLEPIWDDIISKVKEKRWNELLRMDQLYLWGDYLRRKKVQVSPVSHVDLRIMDDFHPDVRGLALLQELNLLIDSKHRYGIDLFGRDALLWEDCRLLFQSWYLGSELYHQSYETDVPYHNKPGLIHGETPLHGLKKTHEYLSKLKEAGFTLGIGTGRPRREIITPLTEWNMLEYFSEDRISTYDEVENAEIELNLNNESKRLGKPHPYMFARSIFPEKHTKELAATEDRIPNAEKVLIVGDAQADLWPAQTMKCHAAAVLSGAIGVSAKKELEVAKPDVICHDIIELTEALVKLKTTGDNSS